jgi:CHAD domain-containing protein
MRPYLEPFRQFLVSHYGEQHRALVRHLSSPRFRTLLKDWREFLDAPVPEFSAVPNAMRLIRGVSDERTGRMYRRVIKEGRAIRPDSAPAELHELRKSCKKLRYLMEFFESLYPGNDINKLVKILKGLLDNLGNFQDLAVQAVSLRHLAQQMEEEGVATTDALLAMGVLVGNLYQRQQQARVEFAEIFAKFDISANEKMFQDLFQGRKRQEPAA